MPWGAMKGRLMETGRMFQVVQGARGRPLGVTSFYRLRPINAQVGGGWARGTRRERRLICCIPLIGVWRVFISGFVSTAG